MGTAIKALLSAFSKEHNVNIVGGSVAVAKTISYLIHPMFTTEAVNL